MRGAWRSLRVYALAQAIGLLVRVWAGELYVLLKITGMAIFRSMYGQSPESVGRETRITTTRTALH